MDTGWNQRLAILRRDVEKSIIGPLKHHGWTASIEREVSAGEYVVVKAERGGHARTAAFLYTSSTSNAVYRSLDTQVDAIFFHGAPFQLESLTQGIQKPVRATGDFHLTLLEWNRETADGKFAPEAVELPDLDEDKRPSPDALNELRRTSAVLSSQTAGNPFMVNGAIALVAIQKTPAQAKLD